MESVLFQNKLWPLISNGIIAGLLTLGPSLGSFSAPTLGPTYACRFLYIRVYRYVKMEKSWLYINIAGKHLLAEVSRDFCEDVNLGFGDLFCLEGP